MMWDNSFGWTGMIFGALMMLIFWGGAITVVVLLVRGLTGPRQPIDTGGSSTAAHAKPLDILKERYAKGEITKAEYEEMQRELA